MHSTVFFGALLMTHWLNAHFSPVPFELSNYDGRPSCLQLIEKVLVHKSHQQSIDDL